MANYVKEFKDIQIGDSVYDLLDHKIGKVSQIITGDDGMRRILVSLDKYPGKLHYRDWPYFNVRAHSSVVRASDS